MDAGETVPNDLPFDAPEPSDDWEKLNPEAAATVPPPTPALTVIVVGSYAWTNRGTVSDALVELWENHGKPPVQLVTSGCPLGAELYAREIAQGFGWEVVNVRDEELPLLPNAIAVVFIKDDSPVASKLGTELGRRMWIQVHTEYTKRQVSEWSNR